MALIVNKAAQDWRLLIEIYLTGKTLKIAEESLAFDSGFYDGRLQDVGVIDQSAGRVLDPKLVSSRNTFRIDNADGLYSTYYDDYTWVNREVVIKAGQGLVIGDYEEIYRGRVLTSGGIKLTEQEMTVTVDDVRSKDQRTLPINKFLPTNYANMEVLKRWYPIPIVYGDWSSSAGSERVPAVQIDSTVGTGGSFKIADHTVKQIESVYKNGSSVAFSAASLANATFTLDVAYDPLVDKIDVHCQGITDDGNSSGTLITSLPDIVQHILTTYLGVSSGNIDSSAFAAWESELTSSDDGRRWIGTDISSNVLITEALLEGFADMTIQANKYAPKYRLVPLGSMDTFREGDLMNRYDGSKDFVVHQDPEENYVNTIAVDYAYNPVERQFARYEKDDTLEITDAGTRVRRLLTLNWLYKDTGAEHRGQRELLSFATITEHLTTTVGPRALMKEPTDFFRIAYGKYTGNAMQVRTIRKDFAKMSAQINAWSVGSLEAGRWTVDTAPVWNSSDEQEQDEHGFWTDSDGYAGQLGGGQTPGSDNSNWF